MSADRKLFQAPKAYPQAPKGMWYEVPKTPPLNEKPKPIFPWEEYQAKPTRVFADEIALSPEATPSVSTDNDTLAELTSPPTPSSQSTAEPFGSYSRTNAWDEMPEIERYVSALAQSRRAKVEVLLNKLGTDEDALLPGGEKPSERRPSMRLTDFPTEIERPSLPVTPAPIRRPSFWGEERNSMGDLPGAEGVPKQEDWNPTARLEELQRRQSAVLAQGPTSPTRTIPDRQLPESAVLLPTSEETLVPRTSVVSTLPLSGGASPHGLKEPKPAFEELDFGKRVLERSGEDEGVFSPTE